jgi:hypothetical protein
VTEAAVDSIKKGGGSASEQKRTAKELIEIEWKVIDKLVHIAEISKNDNKRAFYYQTLTGHIRTLSVLLKLWGDTDQKQDLAKLLSEIHKRAQTIAKRLKQNDERRTANRRKPRQ